MAVGDAEQGLGGAVVVVQQKLGDGAEVGFDKFDDEIRRQSEIAGFDAEYPGAEAVEGLDAAVLAVGPAGFPDGAAHVLGGAVGEGDAEGFLRRHAPGDDGGEAVGHEPGFPGACRGQYLERAIKMAEDGCLLWVGIAHGIGVMRVSEQSQIY